ncbi:MAG: S8 family serine peptidase [Nitrospiraceae bacterium]|nr:S8 family serine peptidase [Nitrospira sp.]MCB9774179.1 S8 family serine peptidase [Nitrospiraceae bacterium]
MKRILRAINLLQVASLIFFVGLESGAVSEALGQHITKPKPKSFLIEGEFVVLFPDELLENLIAIKELFSSTEDVMKIQRKFWLGKDPGKMVLPSIDKPSGLSNKNLLDLQKILPFIPTPDENKALAFQAQSLTNLRDIIDNTDFKKFNLKSQPEILNSILGTVVFKTDKGETEKTLKDALIGAINAKSKPTIGGVKNFTKGMNKIIVEQNVRLVLHSHRQSPPNDAFWLTDNQTQITDADGLVQPISKLWGLEKIGMVKAWEKLEEQGILNWSQREAGKIIVAIIDSGLMVKHPDLEKNIWVNPKNSGNNLNGYMNDTHGVNILALPKYQSSMAHCARDQTEGDLVDENGHGTQIAGEIAAEGNNDDVSRGGNTEALQALGVVGNGLVKLMGVKIFCPEISGPIEINGPPREFGTYDHAIEAIDYASKMGAHVVNISWSVPPNLHKAEILKKHIRRVENDVTFVVAAGSPPGGGSVNIDDETNKIYPQGFGSEPDIVNVIVVTATTMEDKLKVGSNFGPNTVDNGSPGDSIFTTGFHFGSGEATVKQADGTSFAAPFVAGCVALIQAVRQAKEKDLLPPQKIREILMETGDPSPDLRNRVKKNSQGKETRLNCDNALAEVIAIS